MSKILHIDTDLQQANRIFKDGPNVVSQVTEKVYNVPFISGGSPLFSHNGHYEFPAIGDYFKSDKHYDRYDIDMFTNYYISVWIYPTLANDGTRRYILGNLITTGFNERKYVIESDGADYLSFTYYTGTTAAMELTDNLSNYLDQWNHILLQKEGAELYTYFNGVFKANTAPNFASGTPNTEDLYIGAGGRTSTGIRTFEGGRISQVMFKEGIYHAYDEYIKEDQAFTSVYKPFIYYKRYKDTTHLGNHLLVNYDFSDGLNGWITGAGATLIDEVVHVDYIGTTSIILRQNGVVEVGKTYVYGFYIEVDRGSVGLTVGGYIGGYIANQYVSGETIAASNTIFQIACSDFKGRIYPVITLKEKIIDPKKLYLNSRYLKDAVINSSNEITNIEGEIGGTLESQTNITKITNKGFTTDSAVSRLRFISNPYVDTGIGTKDFTFAGWMEINGNTEYCALGRVADILMRVRYRSGIPDILTNLTVFGQTIPAISIYNRVSLDSFFHYLITSKDSVLYVYVNGVYIQTEALLNSGTNTSNCYIESNGDFRDEFLFSEVAEIDPTGYAIGDKVFQPPMRRGLNSEFIQFPIP